MKNDLLDAECVIQHLEVLQVISVTDWHDRNKSDHDYYVRFYKPDRPGEIQLQIVKLDEHCYVPRSSVTILSYRHNFNTGNIFSNCKVSA